MVHKLRYYLVEAKTIKQKVQKSPLPLRHARVGRNGTHRPVGQVRLAPDEANKRGYGHASR